MDVGSVSDWIGLVGGATAFWFGYQQYVDAQAWKRAEFLAAEMKAFFADANVARALIFIDYSEIRLDAAGQPSRQGAMFNDVILIRSLAIHTEFENGIESFSQEEMIARNAWDAFFSGLERFSHYVSTGLISTKDLSPYLEYWITKVAVVDPNWKPQPFFVAVHRFVDGYNYTGVRSLFNEFGAPPLVS